MNLLEKKQHLRELLKKDFIKGSVIVHYISLAGFEHREFAIQGNYLTLWVSTKNNLDPPYVITTEYKQITEIYFKSEDPERFL